MAFVGNIANIVIPFPKDLPTIGGLYWGDLDATIPGATMVIDTDMELLGFIAEEGIDSARDTPTTDIFAWGGDLVASPQDNATASETFTLYEFLNPEVAKAAYRDQNVTVTAATVSSGTKMSILETNDQHDMHTWVVDTYGIGGKRVQKFVPLGQVVSKDTQTWNHKTILSHRLTVKLFPDTSGNIAYIRTDDGVFSV